MKIAIRDDDTSYYTKIEDLEAAFSELKGFPISLAVVPYGVTDHAGLRPYGNAVEIAKYADIAENTELVAYIKEGMRQGRYEVIQHGVTHELKRSPEGEILAETDFLAENELHKAIECGKKHLEEVFDTNISTFAAPCNAVSPRCSQVLDQMGMNAYFVARWRMVRKISLHYIVNFLKSNFFRLFTGIKYGGVLHYSHHEEMNIHEFLGLDESWEHYLKCKKHGFPMVLYTHYWELNADDRKKKELTELIKRAVEDGAEPAFVSACF